MWLTLEKLGVPDHTIDIIRSFHDGVMAQIKLNGTLTEPISVDNGLRQSCCINPVLSNIYVCFVIERWSTRVQDPSVGVMINYKYDKSYFGDTRAILLKWCC